MSAVTTPSPIHREPELLGQTVVVIGGSAGIGLLFGNSADEYLKVRDRGLSQADVTEGSGGIWERLHYDWSDPNHVIRRGRRTRRQEPQGTAARLRAREHRQARLGNTGEKNGNLKCN